MQPNETNSKGINLSALTKKEYVLPFVLVTFLFFLWGVVHSLNGILIPHLKKACELNNTQSIYIDQVVFLAYFLMAIPAGMILQKWGYKKGIIGGLILAGIGALMFLPAADGRTYSVFLLALFIIGCGIAILETAANPYSAILGDEEGASSRLNLGAAINGVGQVIGPIIGSALIFSGINHTEAEMNAMSVAEKAAYLDMESGSVKTPYLLIAGGFIVVAILFILFKLPEAKDESKGTKLGEFFKTFRHRHLKWAVIAQFAYVGAQVCVTSFFVRMAMKYGGVDEKTAGYYLGFIYGGLFLLGRFIGVFLTSKFSSQRLLTIYSVIAVLLCAAAMMASGRMVIYCLGALGFFMSIMFPTIFALGLVGLGKETKAGGSLLVMAIVGGSVIPFFMGRIIDATNDNIQLGYIVPLVCFLVVLLFGVWGYKPAFKKAE